MPKLTLPELGEYCANTKGPTHKLIGPHDDIPLQSVASWFDQRPVGALYTEAIGNAIDYVLDGRRTGRFDLRLPTVHTGERASVGAKLEYEVLRVFKLPKIKPLDSAVHGIPVDFKATITKNWTIPSEAHCQICICTQIELSKNRHRTFLIRTHRSWLHEGENRDGKRGLAARARDLWSVPLYDWTPLPVNPLRYLTEDQADEVLAEKPGQLKRLLKMFHYLEGRVIPRNVIMTVGSGKDDPVRRAREARAEARELGLELLCGDWVESREIAASHGFALRPGEWLALRHIDGEVHGLLQDGDGADRPDAAPQKGSDR